MKHVFRAVVPVDDQWHTLELSGPIVHVGTRGEDYIELWFIDDPATEPQTRQFRVFGTGQTITRDTGTHIGTAITPDGGRYVWHLFERRTP